MQKQDCGSYVDRCASENTTWHKPHDASYPVSSTAYGRIRWNMGRETSELLCILSLKFDFHAAISRTTCFPGWWIKHRRPRSPLEIWLCALCWLISWRFTRHQWSLLFRFARRDFCTNELSLQSFTHALYTLAVMPHYIQPMREEVEAVVSEEGWTKASMSKLYKVDSFLKESQRFTGLASRTQLFYPWLPFFAQASFPVTMDRKVLKDFTFSDGTFIPKGSYLNVPTALHRDDENYSNPSIFDGFRFVDMDVSEGDRRKSQMVR